MIEPRKIEPGVIRELPAFLRQLQPLGSRARRVVSEFDFRPLRRGSTTNRRERRGEQALYFIGELAALRPRGFDLVARHARAGILIRTTAHRHERDGAGKIVLDFVHREARPIAADLSVRERHAMARIAEPDGAHGAIQRAHDQQRQLVINRPTFGAAIDGKADFTDGRFEPRGLRVFHRRERDGLERVGELGGVARDVFPLFRRQIVAENRVGHAAQHRRGMRV